MTEQERLYAQYEDALFALLMHEIAEAEGEALLEQNEQLLADPDVAVPDVVRKRCLRTIEKSRRNARLQSNAKKLLRVLNRVALWLLVPLFLFAGVFAASETVRVRTLNYLKNSTMEPRFTSEAIRATTRQRRSCPPQALRRSSPALSRRNTPPSLKAQTIFPARFSIKTHPGTKLQPRNIT